MVDVVGFLDVVIKILCEVWLIIFLVGNYNCTFSNRTPSLAQHINNGIHPVVWGACSINCPRHTNLHVPLADLFAGVLRRYHGDVHPVPSLCIFL